MLATGKAKSHKRKPLPGIALVFMIIILVAAIVILASGIPQLAKFGEPAEITGVVEIKPPFLYSEVSSDRYNKWSACDATDGSVDAVRQFCQCKGYADVDSCFYSQWASPRYKWTPDNSKDTCMTQGVSSSGPAITNIRCIQASAGIDLVVQSIALSKSNPNVNEPITATITVKNLGTVAAGSFNVAVYNNRTVAPSKNDKGDYQKSVTALAAGATTSFTTPQFSYSSAGEAKVWAQADWSNTVSESNETNNVWGPKYVTVIPPAPPTVVSTTPTTDAIDISVSTDIAVTFSEPMDLFSVEWALSTTPFIGAYSVTYTSDYKTFIYAFDNLKSGTKYTVTIKTSAKSKTGSYLATPYVWSFTTVAPPTTATLTVTKTGSGTVKDDQYKIDCGGTCSASYPIGTTVYLDAILASGWKFDKWGGACSGTICEVPMSTDKSVTANFVIIPATVTLTVTKTGSGSVNSTDGKILCGAICSASYTGGTKVTLMQAPDPGWRFANWGGACSGNAGPCTDIPMDANKAVTANFTTTVPCSVTLALSKYTANISESVTATATVTGSDCGNVKLCAHDNWTIVTPVNNVASVTFTPPKDFPSSADLYNFTAALIKNAGITCDTLEPSDFVDTKTLNVTSQPPPQCQSCGLKTPEVYPSAPAANAKFNIICPTSACNNTLTCPNIGAYVDDRETGSCDFIEPWLNNGAKFNCSGKTTGQHTAYCIGETSSLKCLPVNLPECNETSQKSFNVGVEGPACSGTPKLEFIPGTATKNHQVTASVSNLTNCDGKVTTFNCAQGLSISSCTYSGSTGCTRTFTAPSTEGSYNCTANVSGIALSKPVILPVVDCVRQKPVLTIEPVSQKGAKNDSLIYIVTVGNNNTCMSTFNLDVACLDNWGCELYDTTLPDLDIDEGDSASANLVIKSPATGVSVGSKYTHSLTAYDESANASINTINANYEVALCYRKNPTLKAVKASQSGSPEQERKYSVKITNLDNCSSYYALNLSCEDGWICDLDSPYLYLFDGERADFAVTLTPESGISAGSYNFNLTAVNYFDESKTASIALTYTVTGLRANQSTLDQMFGHYVVGDDNCDTILGENISNSPDDCAPPPVEAPPVCGNNIIEAGEDCDGTSDATCPNLCDADCICPFIIGDAICDASAGESSAISVDCQKKASSASLIMILIGILGAVGGVSYYFMRRRGMLGGLAAVHGVETATPGVNLGTAVNNMLSEGYNPDEIHSNLEAGGWSHSKIEAAMGSAQEDQEALGKLAEQQGVAAPVEKAKATRYVKKCLAQGYDPTQVRTALMSGGWPADAVDGVISKQTASHIQSHAEKAGVAEPSDDIHALKEYVRKEMNEGHTKQDITKILKKSGWSDSDIKDAFGR